MAYSIPAYKASMESYPKAFNSASSITPSAPPKASFK